MNDEKRIVDLWQDQPLAEWRLNMELVLKQAGTFQRKIRNRNAREYVGAAVVVIWTATSTVMSEAPPLVKTGGVLIGIGALVVATILRLRGHAALPPVAEPTSEVVRWHRSELVRQRDLLRSASLWYLGPFIPGLVLVFAGRWLERPDKWLPISLAAALVALVFAGIALLNLWGARKLDQQIAALEHELEG
jgi:hypothetical protein